MCKNILNQKIDFGFCLKSISKRAKKKCQIKKKNNVILLIFIRTKKVLFKTLQAPQKNAYNFKKLQYFLIIKLCFLILIRKYITLSSQKFIYRNNFLPLKKCSKEAFFLMVWFFDCYIFREQIIVKIVLLLQNKILYWMRKARTASNVKYSIKIQTFQCYVQVQAFFNLFLNISEFY